MSEVHEEARAVAEMETERLEKLVELWDKGLIGAAENAQKSPAREGGEVKYSIDPYFEKDIDAWDKKTDKTFSVGTTSRALQSIGVKDQKIKWRGRKINEILNKHKGMSLNVIKQVPNVIENPVLVLKSKEFDSRLVFLGEVYDDNNNPVMAIVELQPVTKGGLIMDMQLIASAYGKTDSAAQFIRDSDLVYIGEDRKRTNKWMQGLGLSLPSDTTTYGPVGRVSYPEGKVKIESVPYKEYMKTEREDVGYTTKVPATKTPMQLAFEKAAQKQERDELPDDRALLMAAKAEGRNGELLEKYQKKVRALEALERKLQRQQDALEAAKGKKRIATASEDRKSVV